MRERYKQNSEQSITMGGLFVILFGVGVFYVNWLLKRERRTDRPAIDIFAKQRGLRVISVTRSYNYFRYWFRGINISNTTRVYEVAVKDSQGNLGDIYIGFDLFGAGRLDVLELRSGQAKVLEPRRLALAPSGGPTILTQADSRVIRPSLTWYEWLVSFAAIAGISGFIFCGILHGVLSPPNRPLSPDPSLGYTYPFSPKHGYVYGTYFEYLAVTYGVFGMWAFGAVCGLIGFKLGIQNKSRTFRWQGLVEFAISLALYYAIWRACIYAARS
jgi:hypothetical protein